uniref:MAT1 domain-containing protein n=1 Tax=Steinernema glaseri TaxID=37863 RepID=A0A1I7YU64_9BILA
MMERENFIRGRIRKIYNLKRDDFETLRDYNDYLERIETIVYNLMDGVDVEATEAEIQRFKDEHIDKIERNRRRLDEDQLWIEAQLREEKEMQRRLQISREEQKVAEAAKQEAKRKRDAIINELKESNTHAEIILDRVRKEQIEREMVEREEEQRIKQQEKHEREQRRLQAQTMSFGPVRQMGKPYQHVPPQLTLNGPALPPVDLLGDLGYLQNIKPASNRRLAGGYTSALGCMRALTEARIDLFAF